jgi:hypothetical protein
MSERIAQGIDRDLAEQLQVFDTRFLLAIHHGDVDVVHLARRELASRGMDGNGRWVGFAEAGQALGV